jgi:cell division inhibitor SulA
VKVRNVLPSASLPVTDLPRIRTSLTSPCSTRLRKSEKTSLSRDGWLAWISPPYQPYAPALAACGIDVSRVLVVRAEPSLWAMEQALRSGACSAVLGWAAPPGLQALRRLQLAAERSRCLAVLFRRARDAGTASPAVLRIGLQSGQEGGLEVDILKSRGGQAVRVTLPRVH